MFKTIVRRMKRSLKWKLISLIASILIFTVSAIGYFSYTQSIRSVRKDIDQLSGQILAQANLNLNRYYSEYEMVFLLLGSSLEFREWLRLTPSSPASELVRYYERIKENYLNRLFLQYPEVLSVSLYNPNGLEQHFASFYNLPLGYSIRDESLLFQSGSFDKVRFIPQISENYLDASNRKVKQPVLTLFKRFDNGYLKMDLSLTPSQNVMDLMSIAHSSLAAVIDDDGTIIHHSRPKEVMNRMDDRIVRLVQGKEAGSVYDRSKQELIVFQTIQRTKWKILAVVPYEKIAGSITYVRNITIVIAASALLLSVSLAYFAASSIVNRISRLRKIMVLTQIKNDFGIRAEVNGNDEVTDLSLSFNNLLGHLAQSVQDLAETRIQQHRAVSSALQSQINSHFLYNTLETINAMAIISRQPNIGNVAVSLSNMLRYTANYKDWEVALADELRHLEDYLAIMKVRYGQDLTCALEIPQELLQASCPKALLQPLVENSIKHTREMAAESVEIRVAASVREPQKLMISVRDNGPGFAPNALALLKAEPSEDQRHSDQNSRIGLANLIYRLRTFYAEAADIRFYNGTESGGAAVEVVLPLKMIQPEREGGKAET